MASATTESGTRLPHDVAHAAQDIVELLPQDIVELLPQGRDTAQAAPGATATQPSSLSSAAIHERASKERGGGIWRLGKSLALDHTLKK